jgi:Zn-dependent peptidase ImmA (M78 family)
MSLLKIIEQAGVGTDACADVLGVDHEIFQQWVNSQREMPPSYASILAATLGVKAEVLTSNSIGSVDGQPKGEPAAIWFKLRSGEFTDADRESILAIRRLGHNANELEQATLGQPNKAWDVIFQTIMRQIDFQASPADQGRVAARVFCELNQFGHGAIGSGEILRDRLRSKGILLIESPLPQSEVEGCSFYVGESSAQRPCIFVNTYRTTWFRRNVIIMHELGHALFDQTSGGQIDTISDTVSTTDEQSVIEVRAETFARETLLPKKLLLSLCNKNGFQPSKLTQEGLAVLVAQSDVEKKTVVQVMRDHDLIDEVLFQHYLSYDIAQELREISDHALSTEEYEAKIGPKAVLAWKGKRMTSSTKRKLLLPVPYVKAVLEAVKAYSISVSRAAELLMIDENTFSSRFSDVAAEVME